MVSREGRRRGVWRKVIHYCTLYKLLGTLLKQVLGADVQAVVLSISYDSCFYSGITIYL